MPEHKDSFTFPFIARTNYYNQMSNVLCTAHN